MISDAGDRFAVVHFHLDHFVLSQNAPRDARLYNTCWCQGTWTHFDMLVWYVMDVGVSGYAGDAGLYGQRSR